MDHRVWELTHPNINIFIKYFKRLVVWKWHFSDVWDMFIRVVDATWAHDNFGTVSSNGCHAWSSANNAIAEFPSSISQPIFIGRAIQWIKRKYFVLFAGWFENMVFIWFIPIVVDLTIFAYRMWLRNWHTKCICYQIDGNQYEHSYSTPNFHFEIVTLLLNR